jgi:hypothetical protein
LQDEEDQHGKTSITDTNYRSSLDTSADNDFFTRSSAYLYVRDTFPDPRRNRILLKHWDRSQDPIDHDPAVNNGNESAIPDSLLFPLSEEYKCIAAAAKERSKNEKERLAQAPKPSQFREVLEQLSVSWQALEANDACGNQFSNLDPESPPPPLIKLMNQADDELMADIWRLSYERTEIMTKPAAIDKYFPPQVCVKMRPYPASMEGWKALYELDRGKMVDRFNVVVMSARTAALSDRAVPHSAPGQTRNSMPVDNAGSPDGPHASSVDHQPCTRDGETLPPQQQLQRSQQTSMALWPYSVDPVAQTPPPARPVDRRLAINSPVEPNPSPALSNDAGDGLGNLTQLTERLNFVRDRADEAGVVPQTRFASPVMLGGEFYLLSQHLLY